MDRDVKGRFVLGWKGGPGRPPAAKKEYLDILAETVTATAWRAIVTRAITDAKKGNAAARKWIADYLLGHPIARVEAEIKTTALTLEEWRKRAEERREGVENADSDGGVGHAGE